MDLNVARATGNLPGVPPSAFEEWGGNVESAYREEISHLVNDFQNSGSYKSKVSKALYGGAEFPLFGPQYGIPEETNGNELPNQIHPTVLCTVASDPFEDMFRQADADIQKAYLDSLRPSGGLDVEDEFK